MDGCVEVSTKYKGYCLSRIVLYLSQLLPILGTTFNKSDVCCVDLKNLVLLCDIASDIVWLAFPFGKEFAILGMECCVVVVYRRSKTFIISTP